MKKISAIVPVYNEESLIGPCIRHLEPFVDEIIVVDGGPTGLSTDKTAEIVESFDKTVYVSGTFKTIPGAWDAGSQKNQGISVANGDEQRETKHAIPVAIASGIISPNPSER